MKNFATFLLFTAVAFAQDDSCKNDFTTAVQCLRDSFDAAGGLKELKTDYRAKVTGCFQTAGCTAPDYEADPFADADFMKTIVQKIESLTPDQKECIRKQVQSRVQQKIEQCLNSPIPQWALDALDQLRQKQQQLTGAQKEDIKHAARVNANIFKAARQCQNAEALFKCWIDVRTEFGKNACDRRHTCAKGASDACKQRANDFRNKSCTCMKKAKQELQDVFQAADKDPMTAMTNLGNEAGGFQATLNQCGVNTSDIMTNVRPKIQDYILQKCKEATGQTFLPGPLGLMSCIQQIKQSKGSAVKNLFATLRDYMDQSGGAKDAFCDCAF